MKKELTPSQRKRLERDRWALLRRLEHMLEPWMLLLGLAWIILITLELIRGLSPFLLNASFAIWIVFIIDFLIKFFIAPDKLRYMNRNWLTFIALVIPAFRLFRVAQVLRVLRIARVARGVQVVRLAASFNRGMRVLGRTMRRRGFGYVIALTLIILLLGSAGMYALERHTSRFFSDYGSALWWTAMMLATMGTYWPETPEGRLLALFLAVYAFAVFGYVTATIATFFIGLDVEEGGGQTSPAKIEELAKKIEELKKELRGAPPKEGP